MPTLKLSQSFKAKKEDVFASLFDLEHLPEMLQEKIDVSIVHLADKLEKGAEYAFSMTRFGLEQTVRMSVNECIQGEKVVYRQTEGLFMSWVHTTKLTTEGERTRVTEIAEYELPFGLLGHLASDFFVKSEMEEILGLRLSWVRSQLGKS